MNLERFEVPGLAQYSYVLSAEGKAVVVDPMRDVDRYLDFAEQHNLKITHIVETHIHADFASGATALAKETGAELWLSAHDEGEEFKYQFAHHPFADGEVLNIGSMRIQAVHTPGHTPEHLSFLVFDTKRSAGTPVAMLTGDFLFVGSLGRPDLLGDEAKHRLASELFLSFHDRIAALPDGLEIHPGHGAGSLCGSGMGERQQSTLGYERAASHLYKMSEQCFVEEILATVPPFPEYYPRMKSLNSSGPTLLGGIPGTNAISPEQLKVRLTTDPLTLLDLRRPEAFGGAHIKGAINIGGGQNLSLWAGWMLNPERPIILIGDAIDHEQARRSLIRVGLDKIEGYLAGGMAAWIEAGYDLAHIPQTSVRELDSKRGTGIVLDVRSDREWDEGHISGAMHVMLGDLSKQLKVIPAQQIVTTVCGSGYRSSIAASVLAAHGFTKVVNMDGGMGAWKHQHLALE